MIFAHFLKKKDFFFNAFSFLFFLFPISLILGNFITNIVVSLIILFFAIDYLKNIKKPIIKILSNIEIFKILLILFFFFFLLIISSIQNNYSLLKSLSYSRFLFFFLAIYFYFPLFLKYYKFKYLNVIFICLLLVNFSIIVEFLFSIKYGNFFNKAQPERMSGIFFSELIAGWYITIFFSLFLAFKGFSKNFFLYLFYILNIFCLILTGEKTSLFSFIIIIIFNLFFNKLSRKFFLQIFSITVIIFFLIVSTNNNIYKRLINDPLKYINDPFYWTPQFRGNDEIILEKYDFEKKSMLAKLKQTAWGSHYSIAYYMFVDKPFFGHGVRSFRIECSKYFYKDPKLQYFGCSTHPHNIFFELLAEAGILNLLLFSTFNLLIFIKCTSKKYINKKNIFFSIFVISIILSIIFPLKPTGSIFTTNYASPYWMLLGMALSLIKKSRN